MKELKDYLHLYIGCNKILKCYESSVTEEQIESCKRLDELFTRMAYMPQPNKRKHWAYLLTAIGIGFIIALLIVTIIWFLIFG